MWKKSYRKNLLFRSRHNFCDRDCIMGPRRPGYGKLIESGGYINSGMAQEKGDPSSSKFSTHSKLAELFHAYRPPRVLPPKKLST